MCSRSSVGSNAPRGAGGFLRWAERTDASSLQPNWRQFGCIQPFERIAPSLDVFQPAVPAADRRIVTKRKTGDIVVGQEGRHPEIGVGNRIPGQPASPGQLAFKDRCGFGEASQPILDRILTPETGLETAALCALVSMDSTMRSNLTVGPPIELQVYETDSLHLKRYHRFEIDSEYLRQLNRNWDQRLRDAFRQMPPLNWSFSWDAQQNGQNGSSQS